MGVMISREIVLAVRIERRSIKHSRTSWTLLIVNNEQHSI